MLINKEASTDLVLHSGGLVRPAGGEGEGGGGGGRGREKGKVLHSRSIINYPFNHPESFALESESVEERPLNTDPEQIEGRSED